MSIVRWDPFRELEDMSNRLNRVFGRSGLSRETDKDAMVAQRTRSSTASSAATVRFFARSVCRRTSTTRRFRRSSKTAC